MIKAEIRRIAFHAGLDIELEAGSILVVIGPNNSGKSLTLLEIKGLPSGNKDPTKVISAVDFQRISTLEEVVDWLSPAANGQSYSLMGYSFQLGNLQSWWGGGSESIGPFFGHTLFSYLGTRERLSDCDPPPTFDARMPFSGVHPFQRMWRDERLEQEGSSIVRRAFGRDFVLHRAANINIPAYIGTRPKLKKGEDRSSLSYVTRVECLDKLENQGDGVRSFVSIVGRVLTEARPVQLIDEPEAFLHPPQARMVAEEIARNSVNRQTIIATHSREVLQGLLTVGKARVSVVRLTNDGPATASYLNNEQIAALWKDPILQFSNILDGLFHDAVVVTEADADCRFYNSMANVSVSEEFLPDIHYTYSGGKDRIPAVVTALASLKVPVVSVLDFDVLNNEQPLMAIVKAHGGDWDALRPTWLALKSSVEEKGEYVRTQQFREQMSQLLKDCGSSEAVPKDTLSAIKRLAKSASPWDRVKSGGIAAVSKGRPTATAQQLLDGLAGIGIFVVPVGEMEGFCPTISGHGPRWVEEVMKRNLLEDPELSTARTFVGRIVSWLNGPGKLGVGR